MNDDPAFLWETQAVRQSRAANLRARPPAPRPASPAEPATGWVTVGEAAAACGVPASTVRNWAKKGRVPSRMSSSGGQSTRIVELAGVLAHARRLGRLAESPPADRRQQSRPAEAVPAEGHLIVPLDAWQRMLMQLGNLHEAGQQLAAATERAAKAETEAAFLRERVAELRERLQDGAAAPTAPATDADQPAARPETGAVPAWSRPGNNPLRRWFREWRARTR